MRSAPAVSYPVGRMVWLPLPWAAAAAVSAAWALQPGAPRWAAAVALAAAAMALALTWWARQAPEAARLRWDGRQWSLERSGRAESLRLERVLDAQGVLLLAARAPSGRCHWLWLRRRDDPMRWADLRRALYAGGRSAAGAAPASGAAP